MLKIEATIATSMDALKAAFVQLEKGSIITDAGLLKFGTQDRHAISLFMQRKGKIVQLFVNDSQGNTGYLTSYKLIEKLLPPSYQLQLFVSSVSRQSRYDPTCQTIAIEDCAAFQQNPSLADQMLQTNDLQSADDPKLVLRVLPEAMMALADSAMAKKRALEIQALVVEAI